MAIDAKNDSLLPNGEQKPAVLAVINQDDDLNKDILRMACGLAKQLKSRVVIHYAVPLKRDCLGWPTEKMVQEKKLHYKELAAILENYYVSVEDSNVFSYSVGDAVIELIKVHMCTDIIIGESYQNYQNQLDDTASYIMHNTDIRVLLLRGSKKIACAKDTNKVSVNVG